MQQVGSLIDGREVGGAGDLDDVPAFGGHTDEVFAPLDDDDVVRAAS